MGFEKDYGNLLSRARAYEGLKVTFNGYWFTYVFNVYLYSLLCMQNL